MAREVPPLHEPDDGSGEGHAEGLVPPAAPEAGEAARRMGNLVFVGLWMLLTCWPLAIDFASAGVFLLEPVPVSIFRGLGFGLGPGWWWRWGPEYMLTWYSGKRWWESGFCFGA